MRSSELIKGMRCKNEQWLNTEGAPYQRYLPNIPAVRGL
jgi:hypothetical protein